MAIVNILQIVLVACSRRKAKFVVSIVAVVLQFENFPDWRFLKFLLSLEVRLSTVLSLWCFVPVKS